MLQQAWLGRGVTVVVRDQTVYYSLRSDSAYDNDESWVRATAERSTRCTGSQHEEADKFTVVTTPRCGEASGTSGARARPKAPLFLENSNRVQPCRTA